MKTPINNIIRCTGSYEQNSAEVTKRQPWQCVVRSIDPVAQYNEFWQSTLGDNSRVNLWYGQSLEESGVQTDMENRLTDDSGWREKLAKLDAAWATLDAQRAEENAQTIAHAEQTLQELIASRLGNLVTAKIQ